MKILIIEDDLSMRRCMQAHFARTSHEVLLAEDGSIGYSMTLAHPDIELMITDYELPGINGLRLLALARETLPKAKLWITSGIMDEDIAEEAYMRGADVACHKTDIFRALRDSGYITLSVPKGGSEEA